MLETIIDTGPILAFFDESDRYSKPFRDFMKSFTGRLYTTLAVVTEVSYLLEEIQPAQLDFIEWIRNGAIQISSIDNSDFALIHKYMSKYKDTPMDFADASLVILANKLKINKIMTFDSDFEIYRSVKGKSFTNILKDSML